ncbi:MAG: methyltransferase domain-containing protein [Candidatus Aminicenantes bacterium]|nr:methyltransferase domain-containing protein [Candidatus Aminicenantes bacterium]
MIIRDSLAALSIKTELLFRGQRRIIIFEVASPGEIQFIKNILLAAIERFPKSIFYIAHCRQTKAEFNRLFPDLKRKIRHVRRRDLDMGLLAKADLFLTSEQYSLGVNGLYSICLFHGQPSKGLTFTQKILQSFDAFFMYGQLHHQALREFLRREGIELPEHLELFDIGYSKSDGLLNGHFQRAETLAGLGLDPLKKTILYAPAFDEHASLEEFGGEIIEILAADPKNNVIAKLPMECLETNRRPRQSPTVDWMEKIGRLENRYPNFRLSRSPVADPLLAAADILVTCVSSISFEFLALGKPVIFIDTPLFFSRYLKKYFPDQDTASWSSLTTINGGREFGILIKKPSELPAAIVSVSEHPACCPPEPERLRDFLLFNSGQATRAAVNEMDKLLKRGARSRRPDGHHAFHSLLAKRSKALAAAKLIALLNRLFLFSGHSLQKNGENYLPAKPTIAAAKKEKSSLCHYLENRESHPGKRGRRDRIIQRMRAAGVFKECRNACEIGAGTGMYLSQVLELARPQQYEVYETARDWVRYLKRTFSKQNDCQFRFHHADGHTLKDTKNNSCDLVHAHAVFVYTPLLTTFDYLRESVRACRPGGYIAFDCLLDTGFSIETIEAWRKTPWRFPVIVPEKLLRLWLEIQGLRIVDEFSELYGASFSNYFILQK